MESLLCNFVMRLAAALVRSVDGELLHGDMFLKHFDATLFIMLPGEVAKHAVAESTKAVSRALSCVDLNGEGVDISTAAGLTFPVGTCSALLAHLTADRAVDECAAIYLTACVEYIAAEVLELSGNISLECKQTRVCVASVHQAVSSDAELARMFSDCPLSAERAVKGL